MMREELLSRLRELVGEKPSTKMGQVRWAWPEIRAALVAGHSLRTIHSRLNEVGIEIGYRTLSLYLGRLARRQAPKAKQIAALAEPEKDMSDGLLADVPASRPSETTADPFSNVRLDRERKKRAAFEYDAFSTNKDLLA